MSITVANFLKECAKSIHDPSMIVTAGQTWMDILNFQSGELYPEIGYRGTKTGTIATLYAASTEYLLDLSAETYIDDVREVYLVLDGEDYPYDNWIYLKDLKMLDLDPESSKEPSMAIANYTSYNVIYFGSMPVFTKTSETIELNQPKIILLKKVCIREALGQVLNDHAKLDRYRTLPGRMNEYVLIAMRDRLATEVELNKRKMADTHPVRSF